MMNYTNNVYGEDHWNGQQGYQPPPPNHHQYHNYYSPTTVEQNSQFHQLQNPSNYHDHNPNCSPIFHTPSQYIPQFIPPTNIKSTPSPSNSTPAKKFQEIDPCEIDQFVIEQRLELEYEKVKSSSLASNLSSVMSKNDGQLVRESDWVKQCVKKQKKRALDLDEQQQSSVDFDDLTTKLEVKLLYYMTLGLTEVEIVVLMVNDLGVSTNSKVEKMIGKLIDRDHPVAVDWYRKNQLIQAYRHRAQGLIGDEMEEQRQSRTKEVSASRRERSKATSDDHTKEKKNQDNSGYLSNMVSSVIQKGKDALNSLMGNDDGDDDDQANDDDKKNNKSSSRAGEKKETKASSKSTVKASKVDLDQLQDIDDLKAMKIWFKRSKNGYQLHANGQLNGMGSEDIVLRDTNYQWLIKYVCKGDEKNAPEYIRGTVNSVVKQTDQVFLGMKYESSL